MSLLDKLNAGLSKARDHIRAQISGPEVDFDTLERTLLGADFGVPMTHEIIQAVREHAREKPTVARENVFSIVRTEVERAMDHQGRRPAPAARPRVILVVGVNGTGKTTTIAKLAHQFKQEGRSVMLAAADTFRAAAIDQLRIWSERLGVEFIAGKYGADPASIVHDSIARALTSAVDVLIIDTAGRMHNKANLMRELEKIKRVAAKKIPGAPHETWLIIDATTGSNAFNQARDFHQHVGLTGLIITKLDGTSRGGMVVAIQHQLKLPVLFLGVGEQLDDLQPFEPRAFAEALLKS